AVLGNIEVAVTLVQRGDGHAEIEQVPDPFGVPGPRELREQLATLRQDLAHEVWIAARNRTDTRRVVPAAAGDQALDAFQPDRPATPLEQLEHVAPPPARS